MSARSDSIAALRLPLDQLPDPLPIPMIERPFDVTIRPPGSKSITNRALLLAALAEGTSELRGALIDADDAQVMLAAIQQLGARVELVRGGTGGLPASAEVQGLSTLADKPPVPPNAHSVSSLDVLRVTGVGGRWRIPAGSTVTLDLHNAGTATRFLTAAAMLAPTGTSIVIDGDPRMRERPIADLADALKGLGAGIEYLGRPGCPPLRITPAADRAGLDDTIALGRAASSQFISALMMVAPFLPRGLTVRFIEAPSWPYIKMTEEMLREVGVRTHDDHGHAMRVWCGSRHSSGASGENGIGAFSMEIEPDASGATYFEAAAALIPGAGCIIDGLDLHPVSSSLQGDTRFISAITSAGARCERLKNSLRIIGVATLAPLTIDLESMPDTAMTAAALACFASPTPDNPTAASMLRGLRTLRVKETDRLAALQTELRKLGAVVDVIKEGSDEGLRITPPLGLRDRNESFVFDTYNDHRMAMSLALIGLRVPGVRINNPRCVAKTYPTFWQDLARLYE